MRALPTERTISMRLQDAYPLPEWKLLYRVLHAQLRNHLDLMDSSFFLDLQNHLQKVAQEEGIDVGDHGAWDAWLGNADAPSCSIRNEKRETWN